MKDMKRPRRRLTYRVEEAEALVIRLFGRDSTSRGTFPRRGECSDHTASDESSYSVDLALAGGSRGIR